MYTYNANLCNQNKMPSQLCGNYKAMAGQLQGTFRAINISYREIMGQIKDPLWYILVHYGKIWYFLIHAGTFWYFLEVYCSFLYFLGYLFIFLDILVHSGTFWYFLVVNSYFCTF